MKKILILFLIISFNVMAETKIKITLSGGEEIFATLNDSATAKDFISKLPIEFSMTDLFGREKYYNFSESLDGSDTKEFSFDKGDIYYWPPQRSFVIIYKQDDDTVPGGMYPLGKIDNNVEIFNNGGKSINVKIELYK